MRDHGLLKLRCSISWTTLAGVALFLAGACGGAPDSSSQTSSAENRQSRQARTATENGIAVTGGDQLASEDPTGEVAKATESGAAPRAPAVGYEVRDFEPVGSGSLTIDGREYPFSVADCHFGERSLSSGWIQEVYVLGAGEIDGRPYFVEVKRGRDARKKRVKTAAINLNFAPLPALYAHEMPTTTPVLQMMEKIQRIDALRSMGVTAVAYDDLSLEGGRLTTTRPVAFMRLSDGGLEGPAGDGTLEVECG